MWQMRRHAARGCRHQRDATASSSLAPRSFTPHRFIFLLLPLLALAPLQVSFAQDTTATGTITGVVQDSASAVPLRGAQVTVVGTRFSAEAGADGRYTITGVRPGTYRLQAQIIGYAVWQVTDVVVTAGQTATVDFRLKQLAISLQEVVVVGYGTQARRDVTGSLASVSGSDVQEVPKANAVEAMKGRVAGVDIVTSGNNPGDGISIRIRGTRSLTASNDPLYVLDGIPMAGGIGDLNPNEIESVEVLKDASATAIYGARGASGVVLITTKQGKAGKTTITYDTYGGMQTELRRMPMMNGPEFAQYKRDAARNSKTGYQCPPNVAACAHGDSVLFWPVELQAISTGQWTDWQDLVLREGAQINNEVRVTGGDEKTRFALSGGQFNQQGIIKGMDYVRRSVRFNFDHHASPRLQIGTSTSVVQSDQHLGRGDGVYGEALLDDPLAPSFDSTGRMIFKPTPDGQRVNPLADITNQKDDRGRVRAFGTLFANYNLSPALNWRVNFGADLTFYRRGQFWGSQTQAQQGSLPNATLEQQRVLAYTLDNILSFKRSLGPLHRVDATFLYSLQAQRTEDQVTPVIGLPYEQDEYFDLGAAARVGAPSSYLSQWGLASFMTRINYAFKDRYLFTVTGREDCSSRLAPGHKCELFPSAAFAWRLGEERFIQNTGLFSDLKLRMSYGQTGNTAINPYQTEGSLSRTMYSFGDQPAVGYRPGSFPNSDLSWERTTQADIGLEFTGQSGRVSGSVDWYRAATGDLLMNRQLSGINGRSSILQNVGATLNRGIEVALSTELLRDWHGLGWSAQFNWAMNRNRIVSLFGANKDDVGNLWFIGYPISVYYDYKFAGIWQTADSVEMKRYGRKPGDIRIVDQNGDGKIDANDRVILGTPFPDWTAGFTNHFAWHGFDLSVMAVARAGQTMDDAFRRDQNVLAGRYNNLAVNYWTPTNPSNTDPRPSLDQERPTNNNAMGFEDGSYIRIRSITLSYTVPGGRIGPLFRANSLRIYASALDPFFFTKFQGLDPESATNAGTPSYRTLMMGVTVGL
jgi:TonB-linked SusC/RagA family outer membrane protein